MRQGGHDLSLPVGDAQDRARGRCARLRPGSPRPSASASWRASSRPAAQGPKPCPQRPRATPRAQPCAAAPAPSSASSSGAPHARQDRAPGGRGRVLAIGARGHRQAAHGPSPARPASGSGRAGPPRPSASACRRRSIRPVSRMSWLVAPQWTYCACSGAFISSRKAATRPGHADAVLRPSPRRCAPGSICISMRGAVDRGGAEFGDDAQRPLHLRQRALRPAASRGSRRCRKQPPGLPGVEKPRVAAGCRKRLRPWISPLRVRVRHGRRF